MEAARLKLYTALLFHENLEIKLLSSFHYFFLLGSVPSSLQDVPKSPVIGQLIDLE